MEKSKSINPIYSITPFSVLEYPDHLSCILWFAGCNMRCGYCYNPEIVTGKGTIAYGEALDFLQKRRNFIDAVVFSGGECTLHQDIVWLADQIHQLGMKVKVDTNGSKPAVIKTLIDSKAVDYFALDFKALQKSYGKITDSFLFSAFEESLEILLSQKVPFEIRTTLHRDLISAMELEEMSAYLFEKGYQGIYFLQHFVADKGSLGNLTRSHKSEYGKFEKNSTVPVCWRN